MTFDALRAQLTASTFSLMGIPIVITLPDDSIPPIQTQGVWFQPREDDQPYGVDYVRIDPTRTMAVARTDALANLPKGTVVNAPELDGGSSVDWVVDGYERAAEPDVMHVLLRRTS